MGFRTVIVNQHSKISYKNNHLVYKSELAHETIYLPEIDLESNGISILQAFKAMGVRIEIASDTIFERTMEIM